MTKNGKSPSPVSWRVHQTLPPVGIKELNVQHSTLNAQRRIKEILNTEKEGSVQTRGSKPHPTRLSSMPRIIQEHLFEIQKGGTRSDQ